MQASALVFDAIAAARVPFTVHVSSSVVNSVADDDYTRTKKTQEQMFLDSGLPGCVLRPTLMYGWFDPKHFGWLARFMQKVPVFPIPGHGRYMRQPLYERDFCRAILWCVEHRPLAQVYDLVGQERADYVDIIRHIRAAKGLRTPLVHIPVPLFAALLRHRRAVHGEAAVHRRPTQVADGRRRLHGRGHARHFRLRSDAAGRRHQRDLPRPPLSAPWPSSVPIDRARAHERIPRPPRSVAVIGAGPMGLAAAYRLAQAGASVTVLERDDRIGGMSAHLDFAGTRIERYYHFVCAPDRTTFDWLREFGLDDRLRWTETKMGFYFRGRLYDWGGPDGAAALPGAEPAAEAALRPARDARQGHHRLAALRRLLVDRMAAALDRRGAPTT